MNVAGRHTDSDPDGLDETPPSPAAPSQGPPALVPPAQGPQPTQPSPGPQSPWSRRGAASGSAGSGSASGGGGRRKPKSGADAFPGGADGFPGGADGFPRGADGNEHTVAHGPRPFGAADDDEPLPGDSFYDDPFLGGLPTEDETLAGDRSIDPVQGDVVDLTDDPFDDDLTSQLKARVPLQLNSRTTLSLAGAVLIVAGFLGGVLVQKNFGAAASTTPSRPNIAALAGGGGFGGQNGAGAGGPGGAGGIGSGNGTGAGGAAGAGRGGTTGTIKFVDGTTVYLTNSAGDTITVKTSGTTAVRLSQTAALKDLPVGATVTVQGAADSDGIITATSVTAQK